MSNYSERPENAPEAENASEGAQNPSETAHTCEMWLVYVGSVGAPGYGQSWKCKICDRGCWRANAESVPEWYDDPEFQVHELSEEDVR